MKHRDLETLNTPEKIQYLLKQHLGNRSLFLKDGDPPHEVRTKGVDANNVLMLDPGMVNWELDQKLSLYRVLGRYIEVHGKVISKTEDQCWKVAVTHVLISKKDRQFHRIGFASADSAWISNVRTSKQTIDATLFQIPASVKVHFADYANRLKSRADVVKVEVYGQRGTILDEIKRTGKTLLVTNTDDENSFRAKSPHFVDYGQFLGTKLKEKVFEYRHKKIISEIIVPVVYITHDLVRIPLGYIQLQSSKENFNDDTVLELQQLAFEMVDRIRDANTVLVRDKQRIVNLSRGGLKLMIDHPDLRAYLVRQQGFTFDVFFKMQAPVTLYGVIRSAVTLENGNLLLGVQISGNSSREGEMKRFLDNVLRLESAAAKSTAPSAPKK